MLRTWEVGAETLTATSGRRRRRAEAPRQALHLHQRALLQGERGPVEVATPESDETWANEPARPRDTKSDLKADATEALIDGFGLSSGRPPGGF